MGGGPDESPTSRVAVLAMDVDEDGGLGAGLFAVFRLHLHLVLQGCHKGQAFCSHCQLTAKGNIPHIQLSVIIITDRFYLVSALKQTHCAHVTCSSEGVTVSIFTAHFFLISTEMVY